jgi:hypothetical protein
LIARRGFLRDVRNMGDNVPDLLYRFLVLKGRREVGRDSHQREGRHTHSFPHSLALRGLRSPKP